MPSMRDIKRRRESVRSTGQITKAMKLVATVKLQKARVHALETQPYFDAMFRTVRSVIAHSQGLSSPLTRGNGSKKRAVLLMTSNRGLAGGYNNNIIKTVMSQMSSEDTVIYPVGRKGRDMLAKRGYEIGNDYSDVINQPLYSDAIAIGKDLLSAFMNGEVGEIWIAYTFFKNTVSHIPEMKKLLPLSAEDFTADEDEPDLMMNFEPGEERALELIVPKYLNSLIYGGLIQAFASENGARMQAMDNATSNAEEMMEHLSLQYNRARQSAITQELTEIVAGASAVE
ncbi:MAG: ATP synthase F1 subunit gamma [Lachnospiraceae bacterium]|nr:ATP synthase F1 subunit gamma [Lachnospiraceae bacterium]MBQ9593946.1 ATP synthase F1 subunit gamma [Lachnospiraceae bacterium]